MSTEDSNIERQVSDLIEDFRDGNLDSRQLAEFRELLAVNREARDCFLAHNTFSELISSKYLLGTAESNNGGGSIDKLIGRSTDSSSEKRNIGWAFLAIAASLAMAIGFFAWPRNGPEPIAKGTPNRPVLTEQFALRPQSADLPIAVLLGASEAEWKSKGLAGAAGLPLREGWLDLVSGTASIRFNSGAVATLIGPARFQLVDSMQCFLASGSMVANVPDQAHGFKVHTNAMQLTDLGTEFGIRIGDSDATEVHVIDGLVEVECETTDKKNETFAMRKNEAKTFSSKVAPADVPVDGDFASKVVVGRPAQRIGYYTFGSTQIGDNWTTDSSATTVGGDDITFQDFTYVGVAPGPAEFPENLNRWSFKGWQPQYRASQNRVGFKVSAEPGKVIQLNNLSLELFRAGGEEHAEMAPQDGVVRISSDGFKTFTRFVLLDSETFVGEPKFVSMDIGKIKPASEYEFRFLFKGHSKARAIRLDEVTLDVDVAPAE
jgi:hypothetical protein